MDLCCATSQMTSRYGIGQPGTCTILMFYGTGLGCGGQLAIWLENWVSDMCNLNCHLVLYTMI